MAFCDGFSSQNWHLQYEGWRNKHAVPLCSTAGHLACLVKAHTDSTALPPLLCHMCSRHLVLAFLSFKWFVREEYVAILPKPRALYKCHFTTHYGYRTQSKITCQGQSLHSWFSSAVWRRVFFLRGEGINRWFMEIAWTCAAVQLLWL